MSDDMIKKLAEKGGVIQINFGSTFIDADVREARNERREAITAQYTAQKLDRDADEHEAARKAIEEAYDSSHPPAFADVSKVADHIDHVVKLVGIDHVGFGSDFDGVGDSLPVGLKDVSMYPQLILELLERGYSEEDIEKVCSGNVLRVWTAVEAEAARLQAGD
jgi:membrane dipeptidase